MISTVVKALHRTQIHCHYQYPNGDDNDGKKGETKESHFVSSQINNSSTFAYKRESTAVPEIVE